MELAIPSTLYGMAVVEPAVLNRKVDGNLMYFVELARSLGMLLVNYCVIAMLLLQLKSVTGRSEMADCSGKLLLLELCCVFLFEVRMLTEIGRGFSIITLLWCVPAAGGDVPRPRTPWRKAPSNSPTAGALMVKEEVAPKVLGVLGRMRKSMSLRSSSSEEPDAHGWKLEHLSRPYRVWCFCVVGLPKLVLDFALAYLGGVYIMKSGNDEAMLLNTMAVVFIAEIDHLLYLAFTSDVMRYNLENMEEVEVELSNRTRLMSWFLCSILNPLFTVVASYLVVHQTRQFDCSESNLSWDLLVLSAQSFWEVMK